MQVSWFIRNKVGSSDNELSGVQQPDGQRDFSIFSPNQLVLDIMLLYLSPLCSCENRQWVGWVYSAGVHLYLVWQLSGFSFYTNRNKIWILMTKAFVCSSKVTPVQHQSF